MKFGIALLWNVFNLFHIRTGIVLSDRICQIIHSLMIVLLLIVSYFYYIVGLFLYNTKKNRVAL